MEWFPLLVEWFSSLVEWFSLRVERVSLLVEWFPSLVELVETSPLSCSGLRVLPGWVSLVERCVSACRNMACADGLSGDPGPQPERTWLSAGVGE